MLLKMSFSGGVLILLIIILRFFAINKLPKKVFVLLWYIVLLRLLLPVDLPFRYGIVSPAMKMADDSIAALTTVSSHSPQGNVGEFILDLKRTENTIGIDWTLLVWLAGVITLLAIFGVLYLKERQRLREALPLSKETETNIRLLADIPKRIKLLVSDKISTPLTFGILSPEIILSKTLETTDTMQLKYVLTHEMVHIKRADNLWKNIMLLAVCIHWFNPLVWAMYILFNRDIELSCDEKVISLLGENTKKEYAMALIYLAEKRCRSSLFSNGFGKNAIQERIVAIMNFKKATALSILCAILLAGAAITVFAQNDLSTNAVSDSVKGHVSIGNNAGTSYGSMSITHESVDILCYEDGSPYIHDVLTNNTDRTIVETQYCMSAYNKNGSPLKLYWNFLDSSTESSFENIVQQEEYILPNQTADYRGGWSLYDGEIMRNFPKIGNGEANQAAYSLFCLKQVVFEDGTVWNNPNYENWFKAYVGKEVGVDELQNYYPYEYDFCNAK